MFGHTVLAQNVDSGPSPNFDDGASGDLVSFGHNLENFTEAGFTVPGDIQGTNPNLRALADNGGWSRAMEPFSNLSPVVDTGGGSFAGTLTADQRGALRVVTVNVLDRIDIGAHEFNSTPDADNDTVPDWWELIFGLDPANPGDALSDLDLDLDLDGDNPAAEFDKVTSPLVSDSADPDEPQATGIQNNVTQIPFPFESDPGILYLVQYSTDLVTFTTWGA